MAMKNGDTSVLHNNDYAEYIADANRAVSLSFVDSVDAMVTGQKYQPAFVYQQFGENESIFGYKNLKVILHYTDVSMYFYPEIMYSSSITSENTELKSDDIMQKLKNQLPNEQLNTMCTTLDDFKTRLSEQRDFQPYGELISKFSPRNREMQLWKVTEGSPSFDAYLERVQTVTCWYIEGAQYTDNGDPRWFHYFLYESVNTPVGKRVVLAGYASLVGFYSYPNKIRPRIAQILLLPQYRNTGNGANFLQSIYLDLIKDPSVQDITAEDPADVFTLTRDYVDCYNCSKLNEFQPDKLHSGFTELMKNAAREKLKIHPKQTRRVYEILRLHHTNIRDEKAMKAYRIDVKRRLEAPYKKNLKDWKKLSNVLDTHELAAVMASQMNEEQKMIKLQQLYEAEVAAYEKVIARLITYPNIL